ncbi:MAG: hypothetical protein SPK04_08490 [Succinivibrionaceae bacterium]|nr:hypothetical protein [Succinivibrionaceae bacterium]
MSEEHILVKKGRECFEKPKENSVHLVGNEDANALLNDLCKFPHAYVLSCIMDRQVKAEMAWMVPFKIRNILGSFDMKTLSEKSEEDYKKIFKDYNLHRFTDVMATVFYKAIQRIHNTYHDDASNIWKGRPSSAAVVYRFLEFEGVGIKIATMATNILARQFKVPFSDYCSIDVSPDVHVKRVMKRMGLVNSNDNDKIIYKARELNPEFPGIIDYSLWEIGRTWCKAKKANCEGCSVCEECLKIL